MTWNKNPNPKSKGWYLCTVEESGRHWVMPIHRIEYPEGNFTWQCAYNTKIVACVKFPKPYEGDMRDKYEQLAIQFDRMQT